MDEQEQSGNSAAPPVKLRVGVTCNIKKHIINDPPDAEAEYDDIETIHSIKSALEGINCAVDLYEANESLPARLIDNKPDIIFNIAEGTSGRGREAHVPAILNYFAIPFTGSDETTMCIALDKILTKKFLSYHHIPTPKYSVVKSIDHINVRGLNFPVIIKPAAEGSGKGISDLSVVYDIAGLHKALERGFADYKQEMLVEEYISGREFTVGILGNGLRAQAFTPMEIVFRDKEKSVYNYEIKKHFKDYVDYKCPPDLDERTQNILIRLALRIYDILACKDLARIDFRMDAQGRFYFIEINPLPGLAAGYSDFPILADLCGVGYNELIQKILNCALERYGLSPARQHK